MFVCAHTSVCYVHVCGVERECCIICNKWTTFELVSSDHVLKPLIFKLDCIRCIFKVSSHGNLSILFLLSAKDPVTIFE